MFRSVFSSQWILIIQVRSCGGQRNFLTLKSSPLTRNGPTGVQHSKTCSDNCEYSKRSQIILTIGIGKFVGLHCTQRVLYCCLVESRLGIREHSDRT